MREDLALFERMEDMINMGAYEKGSNPNLDRVIKRLPEIERFRRQDMDEATSLHEAQDTLVQLMQS